MAVVYIARAFLRRNQASIDPMPFFQEPVVWTIETMMKCPKLLSMLGGLGGKKYPEDANSFIKWGRQRK
ncbi:hypothetical protein OUZ56_009618 [Daphnia magna]|uniref:Uncharacterized protein n=1 Tax=Daphnia magna TaxID=35525 RepID=A0ABR0AGP4_9CRUS|nr:hypothetical protein OUZ56_009618 [Daphnia magna]